MGGGKPAKVKKFRCAATIYSRQTRRKPGFYAII
jgi:hypothetical protein